ncbi:MAG: hypothetical protein EHM12_05165 [Dehalococcoidia bacterium]|nr:MAG: hypothetical protein EHM12_05165 [Dehalococcoidia bacterium]
MALSEVEDLSNMASGLKLFTYRTGSVATYIVVNKDGFTVSSSSNRDDAIAAARQWLLHGLRPFDPFPRQVPDLDPKIKELVQEIIEKGLAFEGGCIGQGREGIGLIGFMTLGDKKLQIEQLLLSHDYGNIVWHDQAGSFLNYPYPTVEFYYS